MPTVLAKMYAEQPARAITLSAIIVVGGLITVYDAVKEILEAIERRKLRKKTKRKQLERQDAFAKLKAKYELTPKRQSIVDTPQDELIEKLQFRVLSAVEVLEAFIAKAIIVNEKLNCITEFIPQAHDWAEKLDALPTVRPLHGLCFAVKDDTDVKGMDTSLGLAKYLYEPAPDSAALVKTIRDLGGIPFCKTNVVQSLYSFGSENLIWGTSLNANFPERKMGPGGSSSGSGSLVGAGCCSFALGSDTGGSGRIPAHFNGVSSIKPTINRLCKKGVGRRFLPGCVGLYGVPSVLTQSTKHLATVFEAIVDGPQSKYDGLVVPIPWNEKMFTSHHSLRIGYYTSLAKFPSFPSTENTVIKAKNALQARGHTLVQCEELVQLIDTNWLKHFTDFLSADQYEYFRNILYGEELSRVVEHFYQFASMRIWVRRLQSSILGLIPIKSCQEKALALRAGFDSDTSAKLWKICELRDEIVDKTISIMHHHQLDLILCPAFPFPSLRVEDINKPGVFDAIVYTAFWNYVDFPAGITRFGTETGEGVDSYDHKGLSGPRTVKEAIKHSVGMPIGVQIVGKKFEEELVLRILNELDQTYQIEQQILAP